MTRGVAHAAPVHRVNHEINLFHTDRHCLMAAAISNIYDDSRSQSDALQLTINGDTAPIRMVGWESTRFFSCLSRGLLILAQAQPRQELCDAVTHH